MPANLHASSGDVERTFSLEEAARIICGSDNDAALQWLILRLRGAAQPTLPGYKVARRWRMTQSDIDSAIATLRPRREIQVPAMTSMTARSQRRLAVS